MTRILVVALSAWALVSAAVLADRNQAAPAAPAVAPARQATPPAGAPAASATAADAHKQVLDRYCVTCHNQRLNLPAGEPLYLDRVDIANPGRDAAVWEKVVRKLGVGAMPPQGSPHPGAPALTGLRDYVIAELDRAAEARNNPGIFQLHRLNRAEYANAIRDLLDLEVDVAPLLPPDSSDFGFDNIASALQVTPALLERYLVAAVRISSVAVGNPGAEAIEDKFPIRLDVTQSGHIEGLPLGTQGGTLVRHNFPADGEYILSGALFRTVDSADAGIEGQDEPIEFQILIDGVTVHTATFGGPEDHVNSRANITAVREDVERRMRARVRVTAGPHDVGFTFVQKPARSQDVMQPPLRGSQDIHVASEAKLTRVTINGPFDATGVSDTPSRRRLFVCRPTSAADEPACARRILGTVARRAYRRPVADADLSRIMAFYQDGRRAGTFDDGIRAALPRILASPSFIYRVERDAANLPMGTPHQVTDLELASRLSFFLWSSIPDEELLGLAERNRLRTPGVLQAQVRRMLADPRSRAMTRNFSDQWLALRNLANVAPDLLGFPDFDDNLRQSLQRETQLFFDAIVRGNRPIPELLSADYTFLNERLARHYGISGVYGTAFRRVTITDENRRGLLGHGSILSLTSVATRTSPVFRGKYILGTFLNTPPLPPPPTIANVLPPEPANAAPRTVRARLEAHRANPVCASCHRSMDPIGFALEGFDAVGKWRTADENGAPVDSSGVLVDGTPVDGPVALRRALLSRPEVFAGTVTEKLLTYALGRGLTPDDMVVVRDVVRQARANGYRMGDIVEGIVRSRPFQMRLKTNESAAPANESTQAAR